MTKKLLYKNQKGIKNKAESFETAALERRTAGVTLGGTEEVGNVEDGTPVEFHP